MVRNWWPMGSKAKSREAEIALMKRDTASAVATYGEEQDATTARAHQLSRLLHELTERKRGYNG
ncbi:hypothetical protein [Falsirhodobacter sp. 20TX0035]|uniref:hypothetical protein n=1 Tax=Falsirhodobacter sp. 20TX0035 TaxID=3022019 RepID=UPI00232C0981|nr:hypothetical protein [Falsirhodobacter sp. 20TX0035]MDB6454279.1 hypothetical protein [Falsirhodobacter sp. 20TX0035]